MKEKLNDLFASFKNLSDSEKQMALIDFLKNNIISMQKINEAMNSNDNTDITNITNIATDAPLDTIYKLLHVFTEQVETFTEKIDKDFYE